MIGSPSARLPRPEVRSLYCQKAHQAWPVLRLARSLPTLATLVALREVDRPADADGNQDPNKADSSQPLHIEQAAESAQWSDNWC